MTSNKLAATVRQGQKISLHIFDVEEIVTGYLAGEDQECYFVLQPFHDGFKKRLVRKSSNPMIELHDDKTFREENLFEEMEEIVRPFRNHLNLVSPRNNRGRTPERIV